MLGLLTSHRRVLITAAVAATALGLAGCAQRNGSSTTSHNGPPVGGSSTSAGSGAATGSGSATGGSGGSGGTGGSGASGAAQSNKSTAASAADKILAAFVAPAGATPLYAPPPGAGAITGGLGNLGNTVQKAAYWRLTGKPDAVFAMIATPKGVTDTATTSASGGGLTLQGKVFQFGPVKGVLASQELTVTVSPSGGGTLLTAVARVIYYPARTTADTLPADLKVLTISYQAASLGVVTDKNEYGPATITDSSKVAQVAAVINALPPSAGPRPCPMVNGMMSLAFRTSPTAAPGATVSLQPGGCGQVQVRQGSSVVLLDGGEGNPVGQILTILGLDWPQSSHQ